MPIEVISTIKPKNNGSFPIAEAKDISVDENGTRLSTKLEELGSGAGGGSADNGFVVIPIDSEATEGTITLPDGLTSEDLVANPARFVLNAGLCLYYKEMKLLDSGISVFVYELVQNMGEQGTFIVTCSVSAELDYRITTTIESGSSGSTAQAIIDVDTLPTEDINENVFYRLPPSASAINGAGQEASLFQVIVTDGLPTEPTSFFDGESGYVVYCNLQDNTVSFYVSESQKVEMGIPDPIVAGWNDIGLFLETEGLTNGGVISSTAELNGDANTVFFVVTKGRIFAYSNGTWSEVTNTDNGGTDNGFIVIPISTTEGTLPVPDGLTFDDLQRNPAKFVITYADEFCMVYKQKGQTSYQPSGLYLEFEAATDMSPAGGEKITILCKVAYDLTYTVTQTTDSGSGEGSDNGFIEITIDAEATEGTIVLPDGMTFDDIIANPTRFVFRTNDMGGISYKSLGYTAEGNYFIVYATTMDMTAVGSVKTIVNMTVNSDLSYTITYAVDGGGGATVVLAETEGFTVTLMEGGYETIASDPYNVIIRMSSQASVVDFRFSNKYEDGVYLYYAMTPVLTNGVPTSCMFWLLTIDTNEQTTTQYLQEIKST